jgi:septum formation protein
MAVQQSQRLILASGSSARRYLLSRAGYRFEVRPADIEEPSGQGVTDIREFVHRVSWLKAAAVAAQVEHGVLIAADSVAWIDGEVIGKPADAADARRILKLLGGREHELWTGVCLWRRPDDLQLCWQERSTVLFTALDDAAIDAYLATHQWQQNSGAYAIQEGIDPYCRVTQGSVSNVIGLPMETTEVYLAMLGVSLPEPDAPA